LVVLVHGGYWRSVYTKLLMNRLASSVTQQGWAAWNIEFRRVGPLGGGGGWPETLEDVAAAVDHAATFESVDLERVVSVGHSSGGHLALWAAARSRLGEGSPGYRPEVTLRAAISLAGVLDLRAAYSAGIGNGAVERFIGGSPEQFPERYGTASPADLLPLGVSQFLVHGLDDSVVPPQMSEAYGERALSLGDDARYIPVAGVGHRDMLDPKSPGWAAALRCLEGVFD
jgi:acetyl esterase/lipase